jgi:hypothetical protein
MAMNPMNILVVTSAFQLEKKLQMGNSFALILNCKKKRNKMGEGKMNKIKLHLNVIQQLLTEKPNFFFGSEEFIENERGLHSYTAE